MYKNYDKASAVTELQRYLSYISDSFIAPSGVYDESTKTAVMDIQERNSLIKNGVVNKETYDAIYSEYEEKITIEKAADKISFPVNIGDYGSDIYTINEMMIKIMDNLNLYHTLRSTSIYTKASSEVQRTLAKVFALENKGFDELFYDHLEREYAFILKNKRA